MMGLTLSKQEASDRVSEIVVVPPRLGRNEPCHCGSGIKYKRCCWERDEALRRQLRGAALPEWIDGSRSKLHQFEKYVSNVCALPGLLASLVDTRRTPKIPTFDVVNSLFHTAVLRIPSINALEGDLKEEDFQKLIGRHPTPDVKAFSADVVANVLDKLELDGLRDANEEALRDMDHEHVGHEGELTAAKRLIDSLHKIYGGFIDAFVCDALYANGPMMTQLTNYGYGGFLVLKKEKDEPFKEALQLWEIEGRCESCDDAERREQVDFWDVDNIETLDTYQGRVRAVRAVVTKPDQEKPTTWCFAIIGQRARQISRQTALRIIRSRWHIEDTGFHQWISYWHLGHVFRHGENPLQVILLIWTLAFNLLQLFIYRRLGRCRRPKDPTDTIRHIVEVMLREVALLPEPIPWSTLLLDTS